MNILFMASQWRFWQHFTPVISTLAASGHAVTAAIPGADPDGATTGNMAVKLLTAGATIRVRPGREHPGPWTKRILTPPPDAILLCPDHLDPMRRIKPILAERHANPPPVITMQHGLSQAFGPDTENWTDHYLCWGLLGAHICQTTHRLKNAVFVTGTPRFDAMTPAKTEDKGFILAHAGHVDGRGGRCNAAYLRRLLNACPGDRPIIVKIHPNDRDFPTPPPLGRITFVSHKIHPLELLRTCHALYLDYPSTCWLEARHFGKPVICDAQAAFLKKMQLENALAATGPEATQNIINAIIQTVERKAP